MPEKLTEDGLDKLTIEGYKSIRKLEDFELRQLNVLIGANGAGKSNFVSFFGLLHGLIEQRLQEAIGLEGGADAFLHLGPKITRSIRAKMRFGVNAYEFELKPAVDNRMVFADEVVVYYGAHSTQRTPLGSGHDEANLKTRRDDPGKTANRSPTFWVYRAISRWVVYHFHDTSEFAGVRRHNPININEVLRPDAENLAAYLYRIQQSDPGEDERIAYDQIRDVVRLAAPFFDDFKLRPAGKRGDSIQLEWLHEGSDKPFLPSQLSDGTLRFICLATALLQPDPPASMLFDEPELGLHPYALSLLANLIQKASLKSQVIISTQSATLLNEFSPDDIVVVERADRQSVFRRLDTKQLKEWLEEYSLGELWQKNVFGGQPRHEEAPDEWQPSR